MAASLATDRSLASTGDASTMPNLAGPTVPVMVGNTLYHLHEALAANASKFFENALKAEWRNNPSVPIDLSEESEQTFEGFMQWLYTAKIPDQYEAQNSNRILARFYVLGEQLQAAAFQNAVLKAFIVRNRLRNRSPGIRSIRIFYDGTASNSPARHLMADMCAFSIHSLSTRLDNLDPEIDGEFMKDLITSMTKYRAMPNAREIRPWIDNPNAYLLDQQEG